MSRSESESTQVIEEETRRLSDIQQFTIQEQEQEEENKKREKNKSYRLLKEYEDYEQAENDLKDFKFHFQIKPCKLKLVKVVNEVDLEKLTKL